MMAFHGSSREETQVTHQRREWRRRARRRLHRRKRETRQATSDKRQTRHQGSVCTCTQAWLQHVWTWTKSKVIRPQFTLLVCLPQHSLCLQDALVCARARARAPTQPRVSAHSSRTRTRTGTRTHAHACTHARMCARAHRVRCVRYCASRPRK